MLAAVELSQPSVNVGGAHFFKSAADEEGAEANSGLCCLACLSRS